MEWFHLQSDSIGALAMFMLSLVVMLYLLSIPNKSRDGRHIMQIFLLYTFAHLLGFFADSTISSLSKYFLLVQDFIFTSLAVYILWFIYCYKEHPFKKEMQVVVILYGFLNGLALYFEPGPFQWTALLALFLCIWGIQVLLRKMVKASASVKSCDIDYNPGMSVQDSANRKWIEVVLSELQHPGNRLSRAYRAFVVWSIINIVFILNALLFIFLHLYYNYWVLVHHALGLSALIWLVIAYVNYAEEKTTFLAKLVGLFLCSTLFLLGVIGFLFFNAEATTGIDKLYGGKTSTALVAEQQQRGLRTLAFLIPLSTFLILVVVPIFFRKNLLRPLSYVLQGVKRVNEGDLTKDVHVEINDEIGYLAQSFNHMTKSLRTYTNEMENLVAHRTVELQQQKEELQNTLEDLKTTQNQLVQREKMASLGELTAGIAHEIQNPLNFVNNFSEINTELITELEEEVNNGNLEEVKAIAKDLKENEYKIIHHGKRAESIVKGMLQHSKASTGKKDLTDINALVDESLRLSYHGLRAKDKEFNAIINIDFDEGIGKINIVPQDISRVLLNLFNNAFYAVDEKKRQLNGMYEPTVTVYTKKLDGKIEILVKDNGNGIPQNIVDKIFQPFFTTKPTGQGTGLGLSLSYDIIKAHGGDIRIKTKEAEYAEFIITLPIQ